MESKKYLQTWGEELVSRILEAARNGGRLPPLDSLGKQPTELQDKILEASRVPSEWNFLRDPIENDSEVGPLVKGVLQDEEARIRSENPDHWPLGSCHLIWKRTKTRLLEDHNITWYSPAEMNPGSAFD